MKLRKEKNDYKFEVSVKILEHARWSDKASEIEFSIEEKIPSGIHPVDYLRQRLSEEIRRHASQCTIATKNEIESSGEI